MQKPKDFKKVLTWSMITITSMYIIGGVAGYATYGNLALSPITLNLPIGATRVLCNIIVTLHVIMACPILLTTFALDMERILEFKMDSEDKNQFAKRILLRLGISMDPLI
jgi:amino acid permease